MDFISNTEQQNREMLEAIGVGSIDELFNAIPKSLFLKKPKDDDGLSEYDGKCFMEALAAKNNFHQFENYLGAGAYEHHVPALVGAICGKSEFLTSYTPYQAEASQGMLQAIFEFQSAICALTDMDAANASVYDAASACAEAVLMAIRVTKRKKVLVGRNVHPHYRAVVEQYLSGHGAEIEIIPFNKFGVMDIPEIGDKIAAVLVQSPNFFGCFENVKPLSEACKKAGALCVLCSNPICYGLFASARELDADIAVGDCQPLGIPLQYGGPYAGYMACKQDLIRQLPGRIVGKTLDTQGRWGYVLTLQAREQHIRREKATSNICTNQSLAALASLIAMLWYGKQGLRELALTNYQRAAYLSDNLKNLLVFPSSPIFNEFVIKIMRPEKEVLAHFRRHEIEPGVPLGQYYPEFKNHFLVAVTETKSLEQLDRYIQIVKELKL